MFRCFFVFLVSRWRASGKRGEGENVSLLAHEQSYCIDEEAEQDFVAMGPSVKQLMTLGHQTAVVR